MVILSDIIINNAKTWGDIFISSLSHYLDWSGGDLLSSDIILKSSNPKVVPDVYILSGKENISLALKTEARDNIYTEIELCPKRCWLKDLNSVLLSELDPLPLSEVDYYGVGTRLISSSEVDLQLLTNCNEQDIQIEIENIELEASPTLGRYDPYLLMDLDVYTTKVLDIGLSKI